MAPSRLLELQPPVSSSDKEASDSEQTTDSEDNKTPPAYTKNSAAPVSASIKSDDDDSESDSDLDSDSVDPTVKPIRNQFGRSVGDLALEEKILKDGLELIEERKRVELEEQWKKLRVQEVELYLKWVELIREQTAMVLEAVKSEKN